MTVGVLLSVDTELTWRAHRAGASWQENYARSIDAAGVGIGYQCDVLRRHGLKACFFVDPMPALLFGLDPVRRMIATIRGAGQEVQLHCHPMWADADRRSDPSEVRFELTRCDEHEQLRLIEQAGELLREAGAEDPLAFRAGSFAADARTLAAVRRAGLRIDSSHNGSLMPWPCATGLPQRAVSPFSTGGLIELPVFQLDEGVGRGGGRLRHLQINAVSSAELRAALLHAEAEGNPLVTVVSHSFELATRDGLRANRIVRRRFDLLCAWLEAHRTRFVTRFAADLLDVPLGVPATPCPPSPLRRAARIAEQGLSNLYYERRL
jgi:peptidoglycan/xylan/chitin deacetylase (PgdA/CDA1 family)